ncbi:tripartite tricarboxylate transporter TctB family protein [Ferdinandcohnia sp. Marseille-Q9671]
MRRVEKRYFFLIGFTILAVILLLWFQLRRRKRWALAVTGVLVISYLGFYVYYPTLKENEHEERYDLVIDYLNNNYRDREFTVVPEQYEEGYTVGQFDINDIETPTVGVTFRVDKEGKVKQIGTWTNQDYPRQHDLWQEIKYIYGETYTLDKKLSHITKKDEWMEGELTAFALSIDEAPTIALFTYSSGGYGLLELQQGEQEGFVSIEEGDYVFIYIDEKNHEEMITIHLKSGEEINLDVAENKGRLLVREG